MHQVWKESWRAPYRFSVTVNTIFENTNYPLLTWFKVLYLMLTSKKGISALQIHRMIGTGSYRTAWFMCHRLRAGLADPDFKKLMGIVEVDETGIGGKDRNRHWNKKQHITGMSGKTTVIGAISRKGNVVCKIIEDTSTDSLTGFVNEVCSSKVDLVATDEYPAYDAIGVYGLQAWSSPPYGRRIRSRPSTYPEYRKLLESLETWGNRHLPQCVEEILAALPERVSVQA